MKQRLYISEYLGGTDRGRDITRQIHSLSSDPDLNFEVIEIPNSVNSKNEWCRDYMPIKGADDRLILFRYNPSYLREFPTHRKTIPNQTKLYQELKLKVGTSRIILDGGAIEIYGRKAIISDRVLSENTTSWKDGCPELFNQIKSLLKLDELIVVPADPWDFTGHVDGMVRFIDDNHVLVNDLSGLDKKMARMHHLIKEVYLNWSSNFKASLINARLKQIPLPCTVERNEKDESAIGIYMNFLLLERCVLMPAYGDKKNDHFAQQTLEKVYNRRVIPIIASKLAEKGGVINCVTWVA